MVCGERSAVGSVQHHDALAPHPEGWSGPVGSVGPRLGVPQRLGTALHDEIEHVGCKTAEELLALVGAEVWMVSLMCVFPP